MLINYFSRHNWTTRNVGQRLVINVLGGTDYM